MRMVSGTIFVLIAAVLACAGGDAESAAAVRDSAGITIVENQEAAAPAWRLSAEPQLTIGVVEGAPEYQFAQVQGAARLGDGRLLVANSGSQELRIYDVDGRYVRSIGRRGAGPGEFQSIAWVALLPGDTIVTWDLNNVRLSRFDTSGAYMGGTAPERSGRELFPNVRGVQHDGVIVSSGGFIPVDGSDAGSHRLPMTVRRFSAVGALLDSIGPIPGLESERRVQHDGQRSMVRMYTPTFGRATYVTTGSDRIYVGDNDRFEIAEYAGDSLVRLIRLGVSAIATTPEMTERAREAALRPIPAEFRAGMAASQSELPPRTTLPAFRSLTVDRLGNLWVERYRVDPDDSAEWSVFDRDGHMIGELTVPERFGILEAGEDYVLGRWRDELDVEYVQLYRLEKP